MFTCGRKPSVHTAQELRLQKVHVGSHEERARQMEAQLKQAESRAARSEEVLSSAEAKSRQRGTFGGRSSIPRASID
ncbi:hypothetical protein AK812_SmicGene7712 [Symbiodinium microadriaticum]|uniref:Uncharacterized protein n=1 Tax=Symbiodinium microadriaticum TaxID=2951 RepID=A0A1Q9EMY7_SYMMI|nr:hypothetical protein AK812_SmicGene7712 [Symbiodinium microadriaticum]